MMFQSDTHPSSIAPSGVSSPAAIASIAPTALGTSVSSPAPAHAIILALIMRRPLAQFDFSVCKIAPIAEAALAVNPPVQLQRVKWWT